MATLVTGAFGCIGAWVCKRLLEAGEKPVAFDLGDDPWRMRMILGPERLRDVVMVKGDIADRDGVTRVVGELADPGYQQDLGPTPRTGLKDGIRMTLDEFAVLKKAGRLDARELEPAK
ncbi:MAG: NAD-dependent epimerase/dehydratase family protein [Candidatus Rokubacteria bacterium]|nr:NAD-dependent epimerase/dehydratase family protein [Candidatus Rokubacteria bacterium]